MAASRIIRFLIMGSLAATALGVQYGSALPETPLRGCLVVLVWVKGLPDDQFWSAYHRFEEAGAEILVAGPERGMLVENEDQGPVRTMHPFDEIPVSRVGVLFFPGDVEGPQSLRKQSDVLMLTQRLLASGALVGAVGNASLLLLDASRVAGRNLAAPPESAMEIVNQGGYYVAERVVRDHNVVTAAGPHDLPELFGILIPLAQSKIKGEGG